MQYKFFTVPAADSETVMEDLNKFLRTHKILEVTKSVEPLAGGGSGWLFGVCYLENSILPDSGYRSSSALPDGLAKPKEDPAGSLTDNETLIYNKFRDYRKAIALENEVVKYFNVFSNKELVAMVGMEELTVENIGKIKGISMNRVSKYGAKIVELWNTDNNNLSPKKYLEDLNSKSPAPPAATPDTEVASDLPF